jgi:two-component system, NtrC family, nitrogen regulation sensor histidine kinase GlnL
LPGDRDPQLPANIVDGLTTAVILLDHNFLILELNPAAENLLGISRTRARGQPLLPLVDDDSEIKDVLARTLSSGVPHANELHLGRSEVHAGDRIIDCRVSLMTVADRDHALLVEMNDVTRRLKISRENALIIQHGAGRQMIRQLAHEIKNPLGGLGCG